MFIRQNYFFDSMLLFIFNYQLNQAQSKKSLYYSMLLKLIVKTNVNQIKIYNKKS